MANFQTITATIAVIVLIIWLAIIGMALNKAGTNGVKVVPDCPDYWTIDGSNNVCVNVHNLGTCPAQPDKQHLTMDFSASPFTGSDGDCQKYNWANKCNVSWENINYGITKSPCDTG